MLPEVAVARILCSWIFILTAFILVITLNEKINIGPSDNLIIFGTTIDTSEKYAVIVILSICNSAVRTMNTLILYPWVINNVQDSNSKNQTNEYHAYEITAVHSIYGFVDWYIYMNILLSQFDLFMLEMVVYLITALLTTKYYLEREKSGEKSEREYTQISQEEV
jgi:hypothetical protein